MSSKKYRSYGIRRENNLSDINNKEEALNNLLNNMPGVGGDKTFIVDDIAGIKGLSSTGIYASDFVGLAGSSPRITIVDEAGNAELDTNGDPVIEIIQPLYRIEDRLRSYRQITEYPPVFPSGLGPTAYYIPSNLIPALLKGNNLNNVSIDTIKSNNSTIVSSDFWALGEFAINEKFNINFPDSYGGILWEGYYIPNPGNIFHNFRYETTGLYHVEYDRSADGNWEVVKSIYAKQRTVTVAATAINATSIQLATGDGRYVSVGDYILGDPANLVTAVGFSSITLTSPITAAINSTITLDMNIGQDRYSGFYNINEVLDRAETPQIRKRIFWWYPLDVSYDPDVKYLRNILNNFDGDNLNYDYFYWNKEQPSLTASPGSIRDLLNTAISPSQQNFGSEGNEIDFRSDSSTSTVYTPKSSFAQINKITSNIIFDGGNKFIRVSLLADLAPTEIGNVIVPSTIAAIPSETFNIIPKNLRIKDLLGSSTETLYRSVTQPMPITSTSTNVHIIDHLGIIDYFVASSVGNLVTVSNTENLKKDMICITASTTATSFVRITEVIRPPETIPPTIGTQFRTSADLNLTDGYVFIYANAGIIDRSTESFCTDVFGQSLAETTPAGLTIKLVSVAGIVEGQVVQFRTVIPANTTVSSIDSVTNTITLSASTTATITQGETIVFAPSGTLVNKEICVLPLDLSPPFVGVQTGLSTDGKSIKGMRTVLNVRTNAITFKDAIVNTATALDTFDRKISIKNIKNTTTGATFSILGKLVI